MKEKEKNANKCRAQDVPIPLNINSDSKSEGDYNDDSQMVSPEEENTHSITDIADGDTKHECTHGQVLEESSEFSIQQETMENTV